MAFAQIMALYNGACDMFIRPQRAEYSEEQLGKSKFILFGYECAREDLTLKNERGFTLKCSHYYRKQLKEKSIFSSDISTLSIKQLKELLVQKRVDPSRFLEKSEMVQQIRILYADCLNDNNNNNNNDNNNNDNNNNGDNSNNNDENNKEKKEEGKEKEKGMPCIVYLHGNSGCRVDALDALELAILYNFSLFSVDLSGSGHSEGSPSLFILFIYNYFYSNSSN